MKKSGLWIVVILVVTGVILGTLGTWSVPLGHGISAFWPAFVVQAAGGIWFGGWGVLAAVLFPIFTNALANVGWSGILGFIPANLAQGLMPAWAFRHFRADPAIPGRKGLIFYAIWGAIIPATAGGLIGSTAVILFGNATWSEYPLLVVRWSVPNMVVSLLLGIPIMRELSPLLRDLGILVRSWWVFERTSSQTYPQRFQDMPIQLKLVLAMGGAGLGPLLVLSLLELIQNGGKSVTGSMMPLLLSISIVTLVLTVGFLSQETVRPLQKLKEQVESLMQFRNKELTIERTDEIGQLGQAFAFLLDDRRRVEASLQASEEKYRTLVENLNVGVFQSTLDGTFLHANSAVIRMAGYDNWDEFKQLPAVSLYADPADRARLIAELMVQGRLWNVEVRSVRKDGTVYWMAISAVLVKDGEGKPTSILGSVMDITERKRAEEALKENEEIFSSFLEHSPVYVFFKDKDIRSLRLSKNYEQMLGMPISDLLGKTMDDLFPSDLAKSMIADDLKILNEGKRVTVVEELNGRTYETTKFPIFHEGEPRLLAGFTLDITDRKRAEEALRGSEAHIKSVSNNFKEGMIYQVVIKPDGARQFTYLSDSVRELYGISPEEGMADASLIYGGVHEDDIERLAKTEEEALKNLSTFRVETRIKGPSGQIRWSSLVSTPTKLEDGSVCWDGFEFIITERKQAEEALRISEEKFAKAFRSSPDVFVLTSLADGIVVEVNDRVEEMLGYTREEVIGKSTLALNIWIEPAHREQYVTNMRRNGFVRDWEVQLRTKSGKIIDIQLSGEIIELQDSKYILGTLRDITERKQAENALRESETRYRSLYNNTPVMLHSIDSQGRLISVSDYWLMALGYTRDEVIGHKSTEFLTKESRKYATEVVLPEFMKTGFCSNIEYQFVKKNGVVLDCLLSAISECDADGKVLKSLAVITDITERKRKDEEIAAHHSELQHLLQESNQSRRALLSALEDQQLAEKELRMRFAEMEAVNHVSAALRVARTSDEMLPLLLDETLAALECEAGAIWLYQPENEELRVVTARGWFERFKDALVKPGKGISGMVFMSGKAHISREFVSDPLTHPATIGETPKGWGGVCVPIRAADEIAGVMIVSMLLPREITTEQIKLLNALTEMAGTALHRLRLHEQTRQDAANLALTYDTTLEGWARALEMRDQETVGHTRRVVDETLRLAQFLGVKEEKLEDIRRGALLHDIGKMGIPDSVLLKPGTLDEREWEIMRRHPEYAFNLLNQIEYLRAASNIPYCHHEKWDGTGYPRGLKGEEIPLEARIFAVVDVWDALTNDRPYRPAWSREKTLEYIYKQSGKHFDPNVVEKFLLIIQEDIT